MSESRVTSGNAATSPLRSRIFRLTLLYVGLFGAAVILLACIVYWSTTEAVTRQTDATIDAEIRGLAEQFSERGLSGLLDSIRRRSSTEDASRGLYLLTDANLRPLAGNLSRWPDEQPDEAGRVTFPLELPEAAGGESYGRARLFELGDRFHLLVGHDLRERSRIAGLITGTVAWGIAGILVLSLIGGLLMSRALLRQIETINATSREIMAGDLTRRIPVSGRDDEFDRLAGNLNAMLDRIERLLESVKQVSDNIAHDLRGPLARLRSRLEVTLMESPQGGERDGSSDHGYRDAIEETIAEADSLLKTFNALLSIARIESGAPSETFEPVDLAALATDVAELFEPLAEERALRLDLLLPEPADALLIEGDRNLLFQALANLLDNAIKFSPPPSPTPEVGPRPLRIELRLRRRQSLAFLSVCDQGPGIPLDQRTKVQERFYRLESSRSTPGSGLGLSLVAAVAALHGGRLTLDDGLAASASGRPGLCASLEIPMETIS